MSHTPGPWMVSRDDRPGMAWNLHITDRTDENTICFMAHTEPDDDNATGEANARLIAAAPELLEALRPFADYADILKEGSVNWVPDPCPVTANPASRDRDLTVGHLRKARAAIAKAEDR